MKLPAAADLTASTIPAVPARMLPEGRAAAGTSLSMQAEIACELWHVQKGLEEPQTLPHLGHHLNFPVC